MRKVIQGKIYDTERAHKVADYHYSIPKNPEHYVESLFLTAKENWFLYCEGGMESEYADGSTIKAYTPDDAFLWLEKYNKIPELEEHFPDRIEEA